VDGNRYKIIFIYKINCFKTNFRFYNVFQTNLFKTQKKVITKYYDRISYYEYKKYVIKLHNIKFKFMMMMMTQETLGHTEGGVLSIGCFFVFPYFTVETLSV